MQRPKPIKQVKRYFNRRRPAISEVVREPTSGGIVYRFDDKGGIEILLIQDAKDRWTIPKGHIEPGESAKECAEREIREETGLQEMRMDSWLGKINFRYRRQQSLVLMTTQIYLVEGKGKTNELQKEEWMNGISWHPSDKALDLIEYEDIQKLMLIGLKRIKDMKK